MATLLVFAMGYFVGARTGKKEWDDLVRSLKALSETEEFSDVVMAARSHLGHTLRELAGMLEGHDVRDIDDQDLVAHVRTLLGSDLTSS
jgi:hypothetical protein